MPSNVGRKRYWDTWWKENREEHNRRRREKYANNESFRRSEIERVSARNVMMATLRAEEVRRVQHAGRKEQIFYLNQIEKTVNRHVYTLRRWRERGATIFPRPLYFDRKGRGMYCESQIRFVAELLRMSDSDEMFLTYRMMGQILSEVWDKPFSVRSLKAAIVAVPRKYERKNLEEDIANGSYKERREKRREKYRKIFRGERGIGKPRSH